MWRVIVLAIVLSGCMSHGELMQPTMKSEDAKAVRTGDGWVVAATGKFDRDRWKADSAACQAEVEAYSDDQTHADPTAALMRCMRRKGWRPA